MGATLRMHVGLNLERVPTPLRKDDTANLRLFHISTALLSLPRMRIFCFGLHCLLRRFIGCVTPLAAFARVRGVSSSLRPRSRAAAMENAGVTPQGTAGRKRIPNRERPSVEDEALNLIAREVRQHQIWAVSFFPFLFPSWELPRLGCFSLVCQRAFPPPGRLWQTGLDGGLPLQRVRLSLLPSRPFSQVPASLRRLFFWTSGRHGGGRTGQAASSPPFSFISKDLCACLTLFLKLTGSSVNTTKLVRVKECVCFYTHMSELPLASSIVSCPCIYFLQFKMFFLHL